jgi:chromosome segregation protein
MLTRLDLIGFKSFADRTRFDFAPGITAVVGPNGSGKSNIVDAVRWVLGEQSAKSLRGGEMADVIFNGSSTRKSLGMAEVTMTFDNTRRILSFGSDEVSVTRRVYRDGLGEYLINGQLSRLKDIKELFLGSGAGHGAYSIIEQGRVDALLTASTKDRRIIFEEAAGISRFKAKKLETLRKLDRVEADLTRVKDILTELDKHLRSLQLQAAKAQKYQEYSDRLKSLRVNLSACEFATLGESLARETAALESARHDWQEAHSRSSVWEAELKKVDWELSRTDDGLRHQTARLADARQQIASQEATAKADRTQLANAEADLQRFSRQRAELSIRIRGLESDLAKAVAERDAAVNHLEEGTKQAESAAIAVASAGERAAELTKMAQADRERQFELVDRHARLQSVVDSTASLLERQRNELARKQADAESTAGKHDSLERAVNELSKTDDDLRDRLDATRTALASLVAERDSNRAKAEALQPSLDVLRDQRSTLRGRIELLEHLDRSFDGFDAGVRAVAELRSTGTNPHLQSIIGLVADLVTVPRDVAPLIDLAIGEIAQRFVVDQVSDWESLVESLGELPGRVGFIPLAIEPTDSAENDVPPALTSLAATGLVRSEVPGLVERLLNRVAIVESREEARQLALSRPGLRIVTRAGELFDTDGSVVVGPISPSGGLLSRKSELRELRNELADLEQRTHETEQEQGHYRSQADATLQPIREREAEMTALTGEASTLREQLHRQQEVLRQLADRIELLVREADILALEVRQAEQTLGDFRQQAEQAEHDARDIQIRMKETDAALAAAEIERQSRQLEHTEAQVALTRFHEQLAALNARVDECDVQLRQRKVEAVNLGAEERACRNRLHASQLSALRATAHAADAYWDKDDRERQVSDLALRRETLLAERAKLQSGMAEDRAIVQAKQEAVHALDLAVQSLTTRREGLATRIRDDYGVELDTITTQPDLVESAEGGSAEMESLRHKIAKLGSVNLEALDELKEVEARATALHAQVDDLTSGRQKLAEIIEQINEDSRKLFSDTLAAVRVHFQELFRKLFGGGMADIVLDDEQDVLESGIDVIARPPGKELRSISLLSGGEKTMTAVALLLAIFRNRPSPFCLLDEVDAALDEANTARLAGVIREFLDRSQFIVITHKKRTMAAADVLYGITMQESGISKQVTVRFEDWPDEKTMDEVHQPAA